MGLVETVIKKARSRNSVQVASAMTTEVSENVAGLKLKQCTE